MKRILAGIYQGLLCFVLCVAIGIAILTECRLLYRVDIRLLNIPESTGMTEQMVMDNYAAIAGYLSPLQDEQLSLPTVAVSEQGIQFFRLLKVVILGIYACGLAACILLICFIPVRVRLGRKLWNVSGLVTVLLAVGFGCWLLLNFTGMQTLIGNTLFKDECWRMYEDIDPVVTLFPQTFFIHAGLFLVFLQQVSGIVQVAVGCTKKKAKEGQRFSRQQEKFGSSEPLSDEPTKIVWKKQKKQPGSPGIQT